MLIGGRRTTGRGDSLPVVDPSSGKEIVILAGADEGQVEAAVQAAESAFPSWRSTPPSQRCARLLELAQVIESNADALAECESLNTGKPRHLVHSDEMPQVVDCFRFFAGAARTLSSVAGGEYVEGNSSFVRRDPIGVVGLVAPWNYPLMMAAWKLAPALAAGNTVVFKPSELTPLSMLELLPAMAELFPPGVVNLVLGDGREVGRAIAAHPRVRMVSLTGSAAAGKNVLSAAASNLKRTHLELGGNAPVLVFADADLERLAKGIRTAGFYNAGQDCTAASRIYAERSVYPEVVERLRVEIAGIQVGTRTDSGTEMGPLISAGHRDRVDGFVRRSLASGRAKLACGGEAVEGEGFFYRPTLITDLRHEDEIVSAEVFGPVVTVTPFDKESQALAWANDSEYALSASVWTGDVGRALRLVSKLDAGVSWINTHFTYTCEMPHGGMKQTGYGSDLSLHGIEDYTQVRHIMIAH